MTEAHVKVRERLPLWPRILAGILICPIVWLGLVRLVEAVLSTSFVPITVVGLLLIPAGLVGWIVVRKSSTRVAVGLSAVALLGYGLLGYSFKQGLSPGSVASSPPPSSSLPSPPPTLSLPSPPPSVPAPGAQITLPDFPWPPPAASASYVLPDKLFEGRRTVGSVVDAVIAALERNGYVERSFFRTEAAGVALVTRLERINEDGSSFVEHERWSPGEQNRASSIDLIRFLRGLFFVDPGRYRVIVFILQDLPFSQSSQSLTGDEARAWLRRGANVLPPEIAGRPFGAGRCTVLVYEFASDGTAVRVVESRLTGRQHLEKAGMLSLLEKSN